MTISTQILFDFIDIFKGNQNGYGVHVYGKSVKGKKEEGGKSFTVMEPITESLYKEHLEGKKGLGISPIDDKGFCNFSVIDYDCYKTKQITPIVDLIYQHDLPIFPFWSKSKGLHIYIFYKEKIKAKEAIHISKIFVTILGLPSNIEIFPKQTTLKKNSIGTFINLPYYNFADAAAKLIGPSGDVDIEEAIMHIQERTLKKEDIKSYLDNLPLADAPPCLQSIYLLGETSSRNEYLFSLARYLKTKFGDDFEYELVKANENLDRKLTINELQDTIISTHKKKDYAYRCSVEPLCSNCNKFICKQRQYGVGGQEISDLSYEDFIQYQTDPPYYSWKINGKDLKFYNETDIINQAEFRKLCFRFVRVLPFRIKEMNWTKIVNTALDNMIIKDVEEVDDISPGALFKGYLVEFLEDRVHAVNKEQIQIHRVYKDDENMQYVFKSKRLIHFLVHEKQFRHFGQVEIQDRLKEMGGCSKRYYLSQELGCTRAWLLPYVALNKFIDAKPKKKFEIDFTKKFDEEMF